MVATARAPSGELSLAKAAGLSPGEVLSRLGSGSMGSRPPRRRTGSRQFGPNALATHRVRASAVLFRQIRNPILILLLGAALVSGLTGGGTNALIIAVIVALSVGLGFFNEYRAEMAMAALRAQIRHEAEVRRDGQAEPGPGHDLVPGDVVSLRIGDLVPADLRLLSVDELECDEGVLTGESMPVAKSVAAVAGRPAAGPAGVRVHGHDRPPGVGARRGGADRCPHRVRADRRGPGREAGPDRFRGRACRGSRGSCSRWRPC